MSAVYLIVGIVLGLGVMILIHEWGHFVVARLCGVRVDVFSIGFGPRIFGWKKGPTDYRVSVLPLGGYVRMAGQDPTEIDSQGKFSQATGEAAPTGAPDELMSRPRWQRALISFAGPAVNLIFPIFLLTGLFAVAGVPYPAYLNAPVQVTELPPAAINAGNPLKAGDTILSINGTSTPNWEQALIALKPISAGGTVQMEVQDSGQRKSIQVPFKNTTDTSRLLGYAPIRPIIDQVGPGTPADRAGIREGDIITGVNGKSIQYWEQFMTAVQGSNGQPVSMVVDRKGKSVQLTVTPKRGAADDENVYQIGVARRDEIAYKSVSFSESVRFSIAETVDDINKTVDVVGKLFSGRVSIKQLQGPVGISHMAGQAVKRGPLDIISFMVLISINLGILNLLPIPILDGGNILLLAIEGIMRRDLSMSFKEKFVQVGLVFLLVIFVIVMYNDILRQWVSHS
ncbi:MAG TPA: RIP metalloprotease RseP [Candidatus Acidoferrum sp.]|nr:RIP metalloprotease RseP [Candidatus Acidoferrum sp.]